MVCFLCLQDIEGVQAIYGEKQTGETLGLCLNMSFLNIQNPVTAKYASDRIGEVERYEYTKGDSWSTTKGVTTESSSRNEALVKREVVLPSEFMNQRPVVDGLVNGIHSVASFVVVFKGVGIYDYQNPDWRLDFICRENARNLLVEPWCEDDAKRLGIPFEDESILADEELGEEEELTEHCDDSRCYVAEDDEWVDGSASSEGWAKSDAEAWKRVSRVRLERDRFQGGSSGQEGFSSLFP